MIGKRAVSFRIVSKDQDTGTLAIWFWCPGCEDCHQFRVGGSYEGPKWDWNGSLDFPTFSPSLLVRYGEGPQDKRCHSFVREGQIQFLGDCSHKLAGQTVDIPDPPAWLKESQ